MRTIESCMSLNRSLKALAGMLAGILLCGCVASSPTPLPTLPPSTLAPSAQQLVMGVTIPSGTPTHPLKVLSRDLATLYALVYEPLVTLDSTGELAGVLALNWTKESDTVWMLRLREGLVFHNGQPFRAGDVVATYEAMRALGSECTYAWRIAPIAGMQATDDHTLKVTFDAARPGYLSLYALDFPVLPADAASWQAGTGPYRMAAYEPDEGATLESNADWWRVEPGIKRIVAVDYPDIQSQMAALDAREIQLVATRSQTVVRYRAQAAVEMLPFATNQWDVLVVNQQNANLARKEVRKALALAMNRKELMTAVYQGTVVASDMPLDNSSSLLDPRIARPDNDLAQASALLDALGFLKNDAGEREALTFRLLVTDNPDNTLRRDAAVKIASQLKASGIKVEVEVVASAKLESRLSSGDFDLALVTFQLDQCANWRAYLASNGTLNYGSYENAQLDELLVQMENAATSAQLSGLAKRVQTLVAEDLPFIGLYLHNGYLVSRHSLAGLGPLREPNVLRGIESWK